MAIFELQALASKVHCGGAVFQAQLNLTGGSIQLRRSHSEFHRIPELPPALPFLVTGIPVEDAGQNGPGAWNPTWVIYCCSRGLAAPIAIPALSPMHTRIPLHLETTGEKFSVTQFWTAGEVI